MRQSSGERREIGLRIRQEREHQNLTREHFAELCESSVSYISDLELGKTGMGVDKLSAVCRALGVSADYILFGCRSTRPSLQRIIDLLALQDEDTLAGFEQVARDIFHLLNAAK